MLGDTQSGKKSLIKAITSFLKQEEEVFGIKEISSEMTEIQKKVYLLDYQFIRIKKFNDEFDSDEIGKINFYMISEKHEFLKEFLSEKLFENLMIVIVMDLDRPAYLTENFISWANYVNQFFMPYIQNFSSETKQKMLKRRELFSSYNAKIIHGDKEGEPTAISDIYSFGVPLLLIGNKSDQLVKIKDEKGLDYI